jgi:hypothetical protein
VVRRLLSHVKCRLVESLESREMRGYELYLYAFLCLLFLFAASLFGAIPGLRALGVSYEGHWVRATSAEVVRATRRSSRNAPRYGWELRIRTADSEKLRPVGFWSYFFTRDEREAIAVRERSVRDGFVLVRRSTLFRDEYVETPGQFRLGALGCLAFVVALGAWTIWVVVCLVYRGVRRQPRTTGAGG